jgi:arginase family enzyme
MDPAAVLKGLPRELPYYLSFDVDCMAPELAPETGTPQLGGLGYYQGLELIDALVNHLDFIGADFVEVAGKPELGNRAASVVFNYVVRFILGKKEHTALETHQFGE